VNRSMPTISRASAARPVAPPTGPVELSADPANGAGADPLVSTVRDLLAVAGVADDWTVRRGEHWVTVRPGSATTRGQGWKLHVCATSRSAVDVLAGAAAVLVTHRCAFKFAATPQDVRTLNARNADRGSSGKFLTAYPASDDDLPALAEALHAATEGLAGPQILSDRPYRPGSLVHYRYGAFVRNLRLTDSGVYEPVLFGPDGNPVPDRREAWFAPPPWAPDPLSAPQAPVRTGGAPREVLVADRFVVRGAIRHANKGGVFRAVDTETGAEVIVKQGRAHVDELPDGGDVRDLLRHEADMLARLAATGHVPSVVAVLDVEQHTFLVTEAVAGVPLRAHIRRLHRDHDGERLREHVLRTSLRLVDLLADVHGTGVVVRDLSPANILLGPDGELCLVDLELAAAEGVEAVGAGTPGFAAPEQWSRASVPTPARRTADLFSLGAILFALVTRDDPVLVAETPERGTRKRLRAWLDGVAAADPLAAELRPLVLGLLADDPGQRCPLQDVRARLGAMSRTAEAPVVPDTVAAADDTHLSGRLLRDGLEHLVTSMAAPDAERLWPANAFGERTDPTTVYYGAAGILGVLTRAYAGGGEPGLEPVLRTVSRWIAHRCDQEPTVLPGLHFGRSGVAWALLDCALALDDLALRATATGLAERIPVTHPIPDVCHGAAGAGLTQLRFWRGTGDPAFLRRAVECADALLAAADDDGRAVRWWLPAQPSAGLGATVQHGFAHGTAGIAAFLLDCAAATGDDRYLRTAARAADALCDAAVLSGRAARWTSGPSDTVPLTSWCGGASGVGSFLVRMWLAAGAPGHLAAAQAAACAVLADRWALPAASCHGVAGNTDFLLDLADATGDDAHLVSARKSVAVLDARATVRDGLLLSPDDSGMAVIPGYQTGVAGVVATLLRLRDGGARLWMPPLRPEGNPTGVRLTQPCGSEDDTK
jgi:hypothetical protein